MKTAMNSESIVLLVDDDPHVLSTFQRILRRCDVSELRILTAENALEGLELLVRYPVALIMSDMHMPGMDGVRLLEQTKRLRPHTVRIMLTADPSLGTARYAVNQGEVFRYLSKPWNNEEVIQAVKDGVERYWSEVEGKVQLRELFRENVELKNKCLLMSGPGVEQ